MINRLAKILAPTVLFSSIAYYYVISINVGFDTLPVQVFLLSVATAMSILAYVLSPNRRGVLFRREVIAFLLVCSLVSIVATNVALIFMCYIGVSYYLLYGSGAKRRILQHILTLSALCFTVVILLYLFGVLSGVEAAIYYMPSLSTSVSALGFQNPNGVLMFALPLVAASVLYISDEYRKGRYVVLAALSLALIALFFVSGSRNGLIISLMIIGAGLVSSDVWGKVGGVLRAVSSYSFIVFTALSFLLVLLFGRVWGNPVNKVLSFRPSKMFEAVSEFMREPVWIGRAEVTGFPVDNMYIFIALSYGIAVLFGYAYVYWRLFRSEGSAHLVVVGLLMLVYGIFEKFTMIPIINIFMPLAMASLLGGSVATGGDGSGDLSEGGKK